MICNISADQEEEYTVTRHPVKQFIPLAFPAVINLYIDERMSQTASINNFYTQMLWFWEENYCWNSLTTLTPATEDEEKHTEDETPVTALTQPLGFLKIAAGTPWQLTFVG